MLIDYFGFNEVMKSLAVFGLILSGFLTVIVLIFVRPPLTTQTNTRTGETRHGIFRWFAVFTAIFSGVPLLMIVVRAAATPIAWLAAHWVWLGFAAIAAAAAWGALTWWINRPRIVKDEPVQVLPPPANHNPGPSLLPPPRPHAAPSQYYYGQWSQSPDTTPRG
jgi:hypothetical protein